MFLTAWSTILAQTDPAADPWHFQKIAQGLLLTTAYGALGIVLLFLGFKVFEWITPRVDLEKELAEKNMAVAVAVAAMLLALGFIIAHTISG
jgi:putative membrane protein